MVAACERARRSLNHCSHAGSASLDRRNRRILVLRVKKNGSSEEADACERCGCLVQDRSSPFIATCPTGRISDYLSERAATLTYAHKYRRPLTSYSAHII